MQGQEIIEKLSLSPEDTEKIGQDIKELFPVHKLILLYGNLGSGKTVLTKGIAHSHGIEKQIVRSPTYAFYNIYEGIKEIYHFDLFKLNPLKSKEEVSLELEEILDKENSLIIIEWANRLPRIDIPHLKIHFTIEDDDMRKIKFINNGLNK